jgi:photosystem II stability/assembly factor-like uncharacterized protein
MHQHTAQKPRPQTQQRQTADYTTSPTQKSRRRAKYPVNQLFTILAASIIGVFLVGSLAWTLMIRHAPAPGTTRLTSSSPSAKLFSRAANATPAQTNVQSKPIIALRMLDAVHGWGLTDSSILKTEDGGISWQDVTPANISIPQVFGGNFMNAQYAWVTTIDQKNFSVGILHTTNGGESWQSSTISGPPDSPLDIGGLDMPHFVNTSEGWLEIFASPGAGSRGSYLFHTTDGGQHWDQLANPNQSGSVQRSSGISFSDVHNGWQTGDGGGGAANPAQPLLDATHDGGQTWQSVQLPALPGAGKDNMVETTPPVMFGNNGLLPVTDNGVTFSTSPTVVNPTSTGLDLYVTHDAGLTWSPTKFVTIPGDEVPDVYITDMQHAWAATSTGIYTTSDGGQNWTKLPPTPQPISMMSFIDAKNGWAIGPRDIPFDVNDPNAIAKYKNSGKPSLLHTTDSGHTWQQITYSIQ